MLQYHAVGGIVGLHSSSHGCYYFLFFQKVNRKHKVLLLGKPSPFTVGPMLQTHAQFSGIKSLALPIEIPVPFGKAPGVVCLSLSYSVRGGEVAEFCYSAINKKQANKKGFKNIYIPMFQGKTLFEMLHWICQLTIYFPS